MTLTTLERTETAHTIAPQVVGADQMVPLLDGSSRRYVYLDTAASAPPLLAVKQKVDQFMAYYSSVHRGAGFKSLVATEAYDQAREIVARFVGADVSTHAVIFGKNTSEAINKLSFRMNFQPGDVVITSVMEHHSNDLPWRDKALVEHVGLLPDGTLDLALMADRLAFHQGRVRLVAVTGASNVTGYTPPIHDIAELAHRHGARVLIDTAQLAPHRKIDMGPVGAPRSLDFIVLSAHKLYAPYGSGALIGDRDFFAQGAPEYQGGGTIELVTLDEVIWSAPPERDEAGSPNVVGAIALAAAMQELDRYGMDRLEAHEQALTRYLLEKLSHRPQIHVYGSADPDRLHDRLGVVTFDIEGIPHGKVASILGFEGGIGVRNGCFCAHPYVIQLKGETPEEVARLKGQVLDGNRIDVPGMVRASFGCFTTEEDIDQLVEMLDRIIAGDYQGEYVPERSNGFYWPKGFDRAVFAGHFTL